jgi:hypothetical protein
MKVLYAGTFNAGINIRIFLNYRGNKTVLGTVSLNQSPLKNLPDPSLIRDDYPYR